MALSAMSRVMGILRKHYGSLTERVYYEIYTADLWESLRAIDEGGLEFINFYAFNLAMFGSLSYYVLIEGDYREFIATKTEWRNQLLHATEGKALDLLSTLIWLVDLDMSHVVIELDCKCVVDKLLHARNDISKLGAILKECKSISSLFPNFVVKFA
ncbi:hypothetical protein JHK84_055388 [Glycine max]|nr:hypothetical protein JHK84_055388 [Glycine max]